MYYNFFLFGCDASIIDVTLANITGKDETLHYYIIRSCLV